VTYQNSLSFLRRSRAAISDLQSGAEF
jgi:hypothetical protein